MNIGDPIRTTVEEISKVLNIENVIGKAVETDEILLLPVTKMGMGFGVGFGEGKGNKQGGNGAGAGGAAGVEPIAIVVVQKGVNGTERVKVMSLKPPGPITRAIGDLTNAAVTIMDKDKKNIMELINKKKAEKSNETA